MHCLVKWLGRAVHAHYFSNYCQQLGHLVSQLAVHPYVLGKDRKALPQSSAYSSVKPCVRLHTVANMGQMLTAVTVTGHGQEQANQHEGTEGFQDAGAE